MYRDPAPRDVGLPDAGSPTDLSPADAAPTTDAGARTTDVAVTDAAAADASTVDASVMADAGVTDARFNLPDGQIGMRWRFNNKCPLTLNITMVLWERVPGATTFTRSSPGFEVFRDDWESVVLGCTPGTEVCYGGLGILEVRPNPVPAHWGVGPFGREPCTDCCRPCAATRHEFDLVCGR